MSQFMKRKGIILLLAFALMIIAFSSMKSLTAEACVSCSSSGSGSIVITKVDGETGKVLAGAKFQITNTSTKVTHTVISGSDGKAKVTGLPYGTYTVVEIQSPEGYILDTTAKTTTLSSSNKTVYLTKYNRKIEFGCIKITKKDKSTGKLLAGAEFEIKNKTTGVTYTAVSGSDGVATVEGLERGYTYTVTETKAPEGYILDTTLQTATFIGACSCCSGNTGKTISLTKYNQKEESGSIEIIKKDSSTGKVLQGAEFTIVNNTTGKSYTVTTGSNGIATVSVPVGYTYTITETKAPEGYVLDPAPQTITVSSSYANKTISLTKWNEKEVEAKEYGDLEITKVNTAGGALAGAVFEVRDPDGAVVYTVTTDANGKATASGLEPGYVYTVVEITAPNGYVLDSTPKDAPITANETCQLTVVNSKTLVIYKVDADDEDTFLEGAKFEVYSIDDLENPVGESVELGNGQYQVPGLEEGEFYIIEVTPPNGYKTDGSEISVMMGSEAETVITIKNQRDIAR